MKGHATRDTKGSLLLSDKASRMQRLATILLNSFLFIITSVSTITILFIIYYIARDALPFFQLEGLKEFFTSTRWYPSQDPGEFGALAIFFGTGLVTLGAIVVAVPMGVAAAICLSDVLPFSIRQFVKPVIEILAAIPSVAYGFFALVVFAPLLQNKGGTILSVAFWLIGLPVLTLLNVICVDILAAKFKQKKTRLLVQVFGMVLLEALILLFLLNISGYLAHITVSSGANALNVSIILGIMALPTVVSVSEDALQAVGREMREGSYALGATRAETILKVILPAGSSGILAAVILGMMRAVGETMVVWMASGNAAQIPKPWYNFLQPIRTMTATIAGDMGEADHVTGSSRFHVLFALALCLLLFSFAANLVSEWIVVRSRKKLKGL